MIPVSLTLHNFLSYGEDPQTLDFTGFRVACLSGDNGHGKSALLDAITYSLWGQARKGRHDRKPDDGLLRLGATHMAVEFVFDLGTERYRVLRSYRRRPRSSVSELELQIYDNASDQYRPLTEAGAPSVTQQRIDELLSMDYDTFTNSAFLLQGQADAFTRKGPRERKQLLGRILGVERYDRLQDLARRRLADLEGNHRQLAQQIEEAATALGHRPSVEQELRSVTEQLVAAGKTLEAAETELASQRERLKRAETLHHEQHWDETSLQDLVRTLKKLTQDEHQLLQQMKTDDRLIDEAAIIEADALEREHKAKALQQNQAQREKLRRLEQEATAVDREIAAARHELQRDLTRWQERQANTASRQEQLERLLSQSEQIEAAWILVSRARDQVARQREHRRAWEELARRRQQLEHDIEVDRQRLEERRCAVQSQADAIDAHLSDRPTIVGQIAQTTAALEAATSRSAERRRIEETTSRLRSQTQKLEQERDLHLKDLSQLDERQQQLDLSEAVCCPLCGTHLDEEHRHQLDSEFATQHQKLSKQIASIDADLEQMTRDLELSRAASVRLLEADTQVAEQQQRLATLRVREEELARRELEGQSLTVELNDLSETLQHGRFSTQTRQLLAETTQAIAALDYQPDQLEEAETLAADGKVEAQVRQLEEAHNQLTQIRSEAETAAERMDALQTQLTSGPIAPEATARRESLDSQIAVLAVDEEAHQQLEQRVRQLDEAPLRLERLRAARARHEQDLARRAQLHEERARLEKRQAELDGRRQERIRQLQELAGVEEAARLATDQVDAHRQTRDHLLERRGALHTRCEQLKELAEVMKADRNRSEQLQSQIFLHRQLLEAFGKDGIQALIIEHAIPEIEEEANAILRQLTDNRIQISIESIRDLKSGGTRETLDVKIADEIGERGYDLYSGGEAFRTDFALRLALSKVLARRAGTQLRTLIIDEGFGTQDQAGLEQLKESIHRICADFDKVLVVTHLEQLKNAFPVQIEVTKHADQGSRFQIHHLA